MDPVDRRCLGYLCLLLLTLFLLTMPGRVVSGDGETVYQTTRSLVTERRLSIEPRPEAAIGRHGRAYGKYGLGQSLAQAPFFLVGHVAGRLAGAADDRPERFAVAATNSVVTAALAGVFWLLVRALGYGRGVATVSALVFGLGTLAWPYAHADFSEPLQALSLLTAFYALVRWRQQPAAGWAALAGAAAALAFLTKAAALLLLVPLGLYFIASLWGAAGRRSAVARSLSHAALFAAPPAAAIVLQAALNYYRFGSVAEFGYGDEPATGFTTPLLLGVQYLLFSSGKGLLFFAPPVVAGLAFLGHLGRRRPAETVTLAAVCLTELAYYARWWAWHGDWSWGPRYLVVAVPFAMLGWAPLVAGWRRATGLRKGAAVLLAGAGVAVSLLGVAVDYGAYYSVVGFQIGRGVDVREARLVPAFSPILGHAWLARASLYDSVAGLRSGGRDRDVRDNPFLARYPWATAYPERVPEAPEYALGFDFWFVALPNRTPFARFWSGLIAAWLAVALVALSRRLWRVARDPRAAVEPPPRAPAAALQGVPAWPR